VADSRTHAERHAAAAETFKAFAPGVEPERIYESFSRRLGTLGSMAFDVVGDMWSRPQLNRRDRSLMVISVLAAQARDDELEAHTGNGRRNGLTREEIEEIPPMVAAYAGYPAAMAASRRIDAGLRTFEGAEALPDRVAAPKKSDAERDRDAADVLGTITGAGPFEPAAGLERLTAAYGPVGEVTYRWAFGEIWSRPQLSRRDRSIVVITILVWLGAQPQLTVHAQAGLRHGLTRTEIEEMVNHLALYAGIPRAIDAWRTIRSVWAELDKPN
jgi:4-carboxymuconolactone decarboxylase